jgi:hypothetical protein
MSLRASAARVVGRSYSLSKRYAQFRMRGAGPPLVVFTMGKTGSTAIARAVQDATGGRVFQVFRLEGTRLAEAEQRYRASVEHAPVRDGSAVPFPGALHLWESEYLLGRPPTAAAPWKVITTVREPVAQAVSAFFHGTGRRGLLAGDPSVADLEETLLAEDWLRAPVRWFDREFAPVLGVDVFEHPFDPALGHGTIEIPAARVLLLRQENLAAAPDALAAFLGRAAPVPVPARNEAATKEYAGRYRDFLAAVRLSPSVLDEVYGSRYARHFYADSELERFRRRWTSGPAEAASR